jgi:hypothetical protein
LRGMFCLSFDQRVNGVFDFREAFLGGHDVSLA